MTRSAPQRSSLREVAEAAGVSVMTVSNVINGKSNVSAETRRRVEQVIAESGYMPVQAARSLRTNRRNLIGLLVVDDSGAFLADPINGIIVSGISDCLTQRGFNLILELSTAADMDRVGSFRRQVLDAIIVIASGPRHVSEAILEKLEGSRLPSVFIQSALRADRDGVTVVNQDDRAGGVLLARHLAERGARSVLILGTRLEWHAFRQRREGLRTEFARHGIKPQLIAAESDGMEDATAAMRAFLAEHPAPGAVVGLNDRLALAAMKSLVEHGLKPRRDVLIGGFNRLEMLDFVTPRITAIRSVPRELGFRAGELAIAAVTTGGDPAAHILPVDLDIGETS